jgi:hypothetical protein
MTPEQLTELQTRISHIEEWIAHLDKSDRLLFQKNLQILDGRSVQLGRTTGTRIGTATDQKIGFLGVTPVIRQGIPAPFSAADIGTALINLGLLYRNN